MLGNGRNFALQQGSKKSVPLFSLITSVMPTSLKAIHYCSANAVTTHFVVPKLKRMLPKEHRLRFRVHSGSTNEVLTGLSGYCLPPDRIPMEMGGSLPVDNPAWIVQRLTLETARQNPTVASAALSGLSLQVPVSSTIPSLVAAAVANLSQSVGAHGLLVAGVVPGATSTLGAAVSQVHVPPSNSTAGGNGTGHFGDLTDRQLYDRIEQERSTNPTGRRADPRMNRALVLSLEYPNLSRCDALVAGGFDFDASQLNIVGTTALMDSEGISLRQRSDQLSRRLREAGKRIRSARASGELLGARNGYG